MPMDRGSVPPAVNCTSVRLEQPLNARYPIAQMPLALLLVTVVGITTFVSDEQTLNAYSGIYASPSGSVNSLMEVPAKT